MLTARRLAAALAIVGAGILAYAVPVSATSEPTHEGGECVDGAKPENLVRAVERDGTATVKGTDPLCEPVDLVLSSYKVPDTWDGNGFNGTAVPQHVIESDLGRLEGDETLELQVTVPECGNVQIDLYYAPEIPDIDINGTGPRYLAGDIWKVGPAEDCEHSESPSPSTSKTETPSPSPTETTSPAPPPIGQPIPVPPAAPAPPPQLAETGANTGPLVGLGAILLGAGIGLSLIGRRRTA